MGEIVNLRRAKKRLARDEAARAAEANRAMHGRTKTQKLAQTLESERALRQVDQAKLEP